jgi:hypothetical protein
VNEVVTASKSKSVTAHEIFNNSIEKGDFTLHTYTKDKFIDSSYKQLVLIRSNGEES